MFRICVLEKKCQIYGSKGVVTRSMGQKLLKITMLDLEGALQFLSTMPWLNGNSVVFRYLCGGE